MVQIKPLPRWQRLWLLGLAGLLLLGLGCQPRAEPESSGIGFPACEPDEGPVEALCGTVEVFEDRAARSGRKIALTVVVLPALHRNPEPDPLFVLVGGPGQGAAEIAPKAKLLWQKIQQRRDIVFVDQRGTGSSNPLDCEPQDDSFAPWLRLEPPAEDLRRCLAGYDADPRLYTTPIAMDDLDEVRETLGYSRINLWGASYGTRAALVYLRRHPEHVRAVILDGAAPVTMKLPLPFAEDGQRALDLLLRDCEADAACREAFPGLGAQFEELLARLEREPARVKIKHPRTGKPGEVEIGRDAVASIVRGALYLPALSSLLPLMIAQASAGDFQALAALAETSQAMAENMSLGMMLSVFCSEDLPLVTTEERERAPAGTFLRESSLRWFSKACEQWPRGEVPAGYHEPVVSDRPVLVLSGELDPVTPPRWGDEVKRHLSQGRHVVVPGTGHGTAQGCIPQLMADFIEQGSAEKLDVRCVEELRRPPFFVSSTRPRREGE